MVKNEQIQQELEKEGREYIKSLLKEPIFNKELYSRQLLIEIALTVFVKGWSYNKKDSIKENYKEKRKTTSRLYRFWCWFWYGHDRDEIGHTMNYCNRCGSYYAGSD